MTPVTAADKAKIVTESYGLIADYARDCAHRGLQPTTIELRTGRLRCFAAWLDRPLDQADNGDVERFLNGRKINARTRYGYISMISCFYQWGMKRGVLTHDPAGRVDRPRLPRLLPRPISDEALAAAILAADHKMRAMLLLASHMGLRCCEIARLQAPDVMDTADTPMLLVHGKGMKDRMVPLHGLVLAALPALPHRGHLFRQPDGKGLSSYQVSVLIGAHMRDQGLDFTAHQLRHWFGTKLYRATRDLRLTQEVMGHADPATTAIYTLWAQDSAAAGVGAITLG